MRHINNHNIPEHDGRLLEMAKVFGKEHPQCCHLGFASSLQSRRCKHRYYRARGEGKGDGRRLYVAARQAFETWHPGDRLPGRAEVIPYVGPVPEVFKEQPK